MRKTLLLASASILFMCINTAHAEDIDTTNADSENILNAVSPTLDTVVVTAQKRETKLQKTPISITVIGGKDIANQHIQSLEDFMTGSIPSLRIAPFFSRSSALTVGIRGMVPFDANQPSRDATVGVYIDGVYLGRSQGLGAALLDVQRIEVLKGPQGTLFGRNTEGGAVSIVTKKPSGVLEARAAIGVGNYNKRSSELHLDLPKFADFSFKIDGVYQTRDGTVKNPLETAEDFNAIDRRGVHFGALFEPNDKFNMQYDIDSSYDGTTSNYMQLTAFNPNAYFKLAPYIQVQENRAKSALIGVPEEYSVGHNLGHMFHSNYKLSDNNELRYIGSWRRLSQTQFDNGAAAASFPVMTGVKFSRYSLASTRQKQWSHEVQIVGSTSQLSYVAGLYYYHEEGGDDAWSPYTNQWLDNGNSYIVLQTPTASSAFPDRASTAFATTQAVFGQMTYSPAAFNDNLHVTLGARYSHDKKNGVLFKVNGIDTNYKFDISSNHTDPLVTVAYDINDNLHTYAKWSTAYRAGGANSRSMIYRSFDAEKNTTSELGFKSEFLDNHARLNLALFYSQVKDMQVDFSATATYPVTRTTTETINAPGTAKIKGAEIDFSYAPFKGLNFNAAYAYTSADMPQARNPFANNALTIVNLVYTPENTGNISVDYEKPLNFAKLNAHIDVTYSDGYHALSSENSLTDAYTTVNARVALSEIRLNKDTKMTVSLWSRNLTDEQHTFVSMMAYWPYLGKTGIYNEPRTYGIDFNVKY